MRFKLLLGLILFSVCIYGQSSFKYVSPVPDSKFINPEQIVSIKRTEPFSIDLDHNKHISITGTSGKEYNFSVKFLNDNTLMNIIPDENFNYGEIITVKVDPVYSEAPTPYEPFQFSFKVKEYNNLPLLKKYYQSQREMELPDNLKPSNTYRDFSGKTPGDYPDPQITVYEETSNKKYFFTLSPRAATNNYEKYLSINDSYGIPLFFRRTNYNTLNFHVLENGQLTYSSNLQSNPERERYYFMDSSFVVTDSIKTVNGYNLDGHDMLLLDNGHFMLISYDPQIVDMSVVVPGGNPNATVIGLVIQEVDMSGNLYFQWRSWDHFEITDATDDIILTASEIDYVHGNAIEIDDDGNLLLSSRHLDEITKIDIETGDIIYRLGLLSDNNEFTFENDPRGFSHQHDVRVMPNGNITIFDNGNLHPLQYSRALEYQVDEDSKIATLVWEYRHDPDIYGAATGSYRRSSVGNHLIGWGPAWPVGCTELTSNSEVAAEIEFPMGVYSYRVIKDNWETNLFTSLYNLDFGNYYDGPEYKMNVFPVANNSDNVIKITSVHLHNSEFEILDQLPIVIQPYDTVTVMAGFKPNDYSFYSDRLTLNYDKIVIPETERIARQVEIQGRWDPDKPLIHFNPGFGETNIPTNIEIVVTFSEPLKRFGGSPITNESIKNIFRFKMENQWGNDVSFSGEINDDATEITIYPDDILADYQNYFLELKSSMLQTTDGVLVNYPESTYFTTGTLVKDDEVEKPLVINVFPNPVNDYIVVSVDTGENYSITITDNKGKVIHSNQENGSRSIIDFTNFAKGMYVIKVSTESGKLQAKKIIKL